MQPESKCLIIKGRKIDYLEVFNESCYWCQWCDEFALKFFRGVNFFNRHQSLNT